MYNEDYVLCGELILAKYFTENKKPEWHEVKTVLDALKYQGVRKADIKEARKRLKIESKQIDGNYKWRWGSDEEPMTVWMNISNRILQTEG